MPIQSIPIGPPTTLVTGQVYALPAVKVTLFSGDTAPALEVSNGIDFINKATVTLTGGSAAVAAGFIRATSGTPTVTLKRD